MIISWMDGQQRRLQRVLTPPFAALPQFSIDSLRPCSEVDPITNNPKWEGTRGYGDTQPATDDFVPAHSGGDRGTNHINATTCARQYTPSYAGILCEVPRDVLTQHFSGSRQASPRGEASSCELSHIGSDAWNILPVLITLSTSESDPCIYRCIVFLTPGSVYLTSPGPTKPH